MVGKLSTLVFLNIAISAAGVNACIVGKAWTSTDLKNSDLVIRGEISRYEVLKPNQIARLKVRQLERLKGYDRRSELTIIWESPIAAIPDHWAGPNDILIAANELTPNRDGASYAIIDRACKPPGIIAFSAENTWKMMQSASD
jgi:hypothetical protein